MAEADELSHLRRSTRAHLDTNSKKTGKTLARDIEYFSIRGDDDNAESFPTNRHELEIQNEKQHEELYAKMYQQYDNVLVPADGDSSFGIYSANAFPPYLGRVVPVDGNAEVSWEIRPPFVIPALRWVLRGLIESEHLTAIDKMTSDFSSGVILTNDAYYVDEKQKPFELLDLKELQRRKRADKAEDEESEEDIELSEYEKLRAERVARNAERLKALGLA